MCRSGMKLPVSTLASIAILLAVTGCADFHLPRIDPSGEHLFICDSPPAAAATCPPGTTPCARAARRCPRADSGRPSSRLLRACRGSRPIATWPRCSRRSAPWSRWEARSSCWAESAAATATFAPTAAWNGGSCRAAWGNSPPSAKTSFTDFLVGDFTRPRLISATSAVGSTTRVAQRAGGPGNSVHVARGQGWVTVSSPVEGVSHVTVVAPDVVLPAERDQVGDDLLDRCPIWPSHPGHHPRRQQAIADHDRLAAKQSLPSARLDRAV